MELQEAFKIVLGLANSELDNSREEFTKTETILSEQAIEQVAKVAKTLKVLSEKWREIDHESKKA